MTRKIPYRCSECNAEKLKLWRRASTSHVVLRCAACALKSERITRSAFQDDDGTPPPAGVVMFTDQIGGLVPAIPLASDDGWWGYTSAPDDRIAWWYSLPTFRDAEEDLEAERRISSHFLTKCQHYVEELMKARGLK